MADTVNRDEKAVTDLTDAEWTAIVDFDGAWERLQAAVERYGARVAREAYTLGRLRENRAIDRALAEAFGEVADVVERHRPSTSSTHPRGAS